MKLPVTITISAEAVAWYAAIVATGSLFLSLLRYLRDRVNVVLRCRAGYRIYPGDNMYPADEDYIAITVTNKGRRPVTIQTVGYMTKDRKEKDAILIDSVRSPREIGEGKSTIYILRQSLVDLSKIKYFVVYDLTGREYRGKLKLK